MADKTPVILVPMGFSEQSIQALDQALVFAKAMKASILLLAINNNDIHLREIFGVKDRKEDIHDKLEAKLNSIAAEHSASSGIAIEAMLTEGVVYEEIDRVSKEKDVDLVIMGTNGKPQNLRKRFIGSNAFRTVTLVDPPVITIKGIRNISSIKTIIFPLVLDRRSKEKVGPALHYARLFGAKIKVVSVLIEEDKEKVLKAHLKQVETFIKDHGIECTSEIIKPSKQQKGIVRNTLKYAYENEGDLMIITEDSKERDFTDFFIGTDVQAMIYHSEIPVMSITPSEVKWAAMWENM
ncbi:universal stress protein [Owenweeksia hongkongensis]|uniref:universal stress protein n=1 Tax=Owenweeksia hongkongensis TaxID=253245 RepID=UPI003A911DF1